MALKVWFSRQADRDLKVFIVSNMETRNREVAADARSL
jgi:hypothetical protein